MRRMKHMLHPVNHHRPSRIVGERDDAFYPEQSGAMRLAQQIEKHLEGAGRERRFAGEAEGVDMGVVAVRVRVVVIVMVVAVVILARGFDILRAQPLRETRVLALGVVKTAIEESPRASPRPSRRLEFSRPD